MTDDYDSRTSNNYSFIFLEIPKKSYICLIAHIISPASSRTLKTFAAALKGAWIITDPVWILKSAEQGKWISESPFGSRFLKNSFQGRGFNLKSVQRLLKKLLVLGKRYYVAPSFTEVPQSQQFRIRYMKYLINECVMNAMFVDNPAEADVIFRGDQDKKY
jgi:hypothetical protein